MNIEKFWQNLIFGWRAVGSEWKKDKSGLPRMIPQLATQDYNRRRDYVVLHLHPSTSVCKFGYTEQIGPTNSFLYLRIFPNV